MAEDISFTRTLRHPTRGDMIGLIAWAAGEVGQCEQLHYNDRSQTAFVEAQEKLNLISAVLREVYGRFPQKENCGHWEKECSKASQKITQRHRPPEQT